MTDDKSNPMRAVLLAALMVLWVFAGTVAFAGGAAALDGGSIENGVASPQDDTTSTADVTYNTSYDYNPEVNGQNSTGGMAIVLTDAGGTTGGSVNSSLEADEVIVSLNGDETAVDAAAVFTSDEDGDGADDSIFVDFDSPFDPITGDTLRVNVTNAVNNPDIADTYTAELRSYEGDNPFSGSFVSTEADYTIQEGDTDDGTEENPRDTPFAGGTGVWKGQFLEFVGSPDACNASNWELNYYTPDESGTAYGSTITQFSLNSSDGAGIPTENVADDERVVITAVNADSGVREIVDVGQEAGAPAGHQTGNCFSSNSSDGTLGGDDWVRVTPQDFNATFQEDSIRQDQNATLDVESNRNGYAVYVDSDDFTQAELNNMVEGSDSTIDEDRAPSDEAVRVTGVSTNEEIEVDFGGRDTGNYSFTLSPTDTIPTDTADIEVTEGATGDGEFDSDTGSFSVKRGDIQSPEGDDDATISVHNADAVDNIVVRVGDESTNNYEATVVAEPDDDGRVDIRMNTFLAGRLDASNEGQVYSAPDNGTILSVQRQSDKITGVMDEGQYELAVENTDGDQFDAGVLNVRQSSYNSIEQKRHPDAPLGDLEDKSDLANNSDLTETGLVTMAERDRSNERDILVHEIDISGVYGALEDLAGGSLDSVSGNSVLSKAQDAQNSGAANDAVLNVSLTQINYLMNREPKVKDYTNPDQTDQFRFVIDEDNETLYLVTDVRDLELTRETGSGDEDVQIETGDDFEMEFEVGPGFNESFDGGIDTYVPENGTTTQVDVEDREAEFAEGSDQVQVNNEANQSLSAVTNVAPGTEVTIQVDTQIGERRANDTETDDQTQIFQRATATVQEGEDTRSNTFSDDSFDFSDAEVGRMFSVSSPGNGYEDDARKTGVVVEGTPAQVALSDVTVGPDTDEVATITVDEAYLPQGGFITIHDGSLSDGATFDSVRGTSDYLGEGNHSDVEVSLDTPYTEDGTAIAMPHQDTNGNEEYDFVTSEADEDNAYTAGDDDNIVTASASVTFETPTATPTATDTPTATATATDTPTETEDQPGFGAALALIALIGAALLAARRRDF